MQGSPQHVGIPLRQLLRRGIELRARAAGAFAPGARAPARLCHVVAAPRADRLAGGDRPGHPPRRHPGQAPAPATVAAVWPRSIGHWNSLRACSRRRKRHFEAVEASLGRCGVPREQWQTLATARLLVDYAKQILPVARIGRMDLLDPAGQAARQFAEAEQRFRRQQEPWPRPGKQPRPGGRNSRRRKCRSPSSRRRHSSRASLPGCGPRGGDCGGFSTTRTTSARTWFARAGRRCSAHSRRNTRNWTNWTGSGRRSPSSSGSTATSTA